MKAFPAAVLALALIPAAAVAQDKPSEPKPSEARPSFGAVHDAEAYDTDRIVKTYYLTSITQQNDANEILIALRNVLSPRAKLYLDTSQNAIVIAASPEEQALSQKIITDLDRRRKTYRLTFTLADSDNGKRVGVQHFSITIAAGQRTTLKQGTKIPVMTGTSESSTSTQFQYVEVGMNFDVSLEDSPTGLRIKAKVEDSSVGSPSEYGNSSGPLAQEPIIHQTTLEGTSIVTVGKPLTLGSVDVAGSTRHIDIEVVAEPIS